MTSLLQGYHCKSGSSSDRSLCHCAPTTPVGRSEPFSEPFNEGAVQVKRLVNRDRKELLGNKIDILDKYTTEFGDPDDSPAAAAAPVAAAPAAPASSSTGDAAASKPTTVQTRFTAGGAATPASPFTSSSASSPFASSGGSAASPFGAGAPGARIRSLTEPMGLSPDMGPDPVVKQAITPGNILTRITLTQVVRAPSVAAALQAAAGAAGAGWHCRHSLATCTSIFGLQCCP